MKTRTCPVGAPSPTGRRASSERPRSSAIVARKKVGLVDRFEQYRKTPLAQHVADYETYLIALRHEFASNLARSGAHPKVAQELLRHSSVELTLGIYTHLSLADQA